MDGMGLNDQNEWWRHAVCYQVYVRSFADGDGDGVGDLPGITSRLPYLHDLGVDALWITPFYTSPQRDHGYDVADYRDVDPLFGSLADADALLERAHALGLKVIVDLVPNHTSDEHEWFRAALAAGPGSRERERYLFRESPEGAPPGTPPNNWSSVFGGPAWTQVEDGQWYLHLFDSTQPDLNWRNPEVGDMFVDVLTFWLDRGVDGFRVDVAHGLFKEEGLRDQVVDEGELPSSDSSEVTGGSSMVERTMRDEPMWDQPEVHEVYRRWHDVLAKYDGDRMLVAEAWTQSSESMARFIRPDEMSQAFNFSWLLADWSADAFEEVVTGTLDSVGLVGGTATWVLSNHDVGPAPHPLRRRRAGPGPRPRGHPDDARPARLLLPLPGRGARPGAGRRARRLPPGPVLVPHRRGRPRRLPGAGAVGGRRRAVRLRPGDRPAVDPAARRLGGAHRRRAGRRPRLHAVVLPRRPRGPAPRRGSRRGGRDDRPRRRRAGLPPRPADRGAQLRHRPGPAARRARCWSPAARCRPARCPATRRSGCADGPVPGRGQSRPAGAFSSAAL